MQISKCRGLRGSEEKRRNSEKWKEGLLIKKAIRWVRLAYRELIGISNESWTIGIERVYK